jgi:hypothetical protein
VKVTGRSGYDVTIHYFNIECCMHTVDSIWYAKLEVERILHDEGLTIISLDVVNVQHVVGGPMNVGITATTPLNR